MTVDPRAVAFDSVNSQLQYYNSSGTPVSIPYTGPTGATGAAGQGVPTGGTTGQVLAKIDATNYNTHWITPSGGGSGNLLDAKTTYGAVGDGSTDDTTALQSAFSSGCGVYLPDGVYIYSALTVSDGLKLFGPGILKRKTTSSISASEHYTIDATAADNFSFNGVTFDGNSSGQTGSSGFRVSGILIGQVTNFNITSCVFKNHQENCLEITSATQSNPTDYQTPPSLVAGTIYRGIIQGNTFLDSGRNVNDGSGYSDSSAIQLGSTTQSVIINGNVFWNCMGAVSGGAYNSNSIITNNTAYVDSSTYTYAGVGFALTQLSKDGILSNNVAIGFAEAATIESLIGGTIVGNRFRNVINGINAFASNIGATTLDLSKLVIADNSIECRGTSSGSFGLRVVLSSGHGANKINVSNNSVTGGETGIYLNGLNGGVASNNFASGSTTGIAVNSCTDLNGTGNTALACSAEGIYFGASNNRVCFNNSMSNGNAYGIYVASGQTSLYIKNSTMLNNSTKDFYIAGTPNNVRYYDNDFVTQTGVISQKTGATPNFQYGGDYSYFVNGSATTVTGFSGGTVGKRYTVVADDNNTTIQHGTNIFLKGHANKTLSVNDGITFTTDDGTHYYES